MNQTFHHLLTVNRAALRSLAESGLGIENALGPLPAECPNGLRRLYELIQSIKLTFAKLKPESKNGLPALQQFRQIRYMFLEYIELLIRISDSDKADRRFDPVADELAKIRAALVPRIAPTVEAETELSDEFIWITPWDRSEAAAALKRWIELFDDQSIMQRRRGRPLLNEARELLKSLQTFYADPKPPPAA